MPDYVIEVDFETTRSGKVKLRARSEEENLTREQIQALFEGLEDDTEFAEMLEAGVGQIVTSAGVARIQSFKKSDVETLGSVDIMLDDYAIPGVE